MPYVFDFFSNFPEGFVLVALCFMCLGFEIMFELQLFNFINGIFVCFLFFSQRSYVNFIPNEENKASISDALKKSFKERRQWINFCKPTATDIVKKYPHLLSYQGEMVKYCHI